MYKGISRSGLWCETSLWCASKPKPYERCVIFVNNVVNTLSYEEMTNTKVVDLDELFNFGIYHFFS